MKEEGELRRMMILPFRLLAMLLAFGITVNGWQSLRSIGMINTLMKPKIAASLLSVISLTTDIVLDPSKPTLKPTDKDNQMVQMAFKDFDSKRFDASEREFTLAIEKWKEMNRPRDEVYSLLKARADVLLDSKQFQKALDDYNVCLDLLKVDGEDENGRGRYAEYPDAFVGRGLAKEGLADWSGALKDYDKAVTLWGGAAVDSRVTKPNYDGVNPFVLTFRGNTLTKLNRYEDAVKDFAAASDIFNSMRDVARYSDARANYALALYQLDRIEDAVKVMNDVIRKNPGYADMRVALTADYWSNGNYIEALKEWRFVCDNIEVGCDAYKDMNWVRTIRRWPTKLADKLEQFLNRKIPEKLKGKPGTALAPSSM